MVWACRASLSTGSFAFIDVTGVRRSWMNFEVYNEILSA